MWNLRSFIELLEKEGELKRITAEVDWNLEAGAITRRVGEKRGPALLFENISGYSRGYRLLSNHLGPSNPSVHSRVALALGLPRLTPTREVIAEFATKIQRRIKPVLVDTGPCKENVMFGDEVDVFHFPVPFIHGTDGGRYIGTWSMDVTRDPDTGHVNWGTYRHMVLDRNHLGWLASPFQHGPALFLNKYEPRSEPMPMAVVIGMHPSLSLVASAPIPAGVNEADVAGALRGEPVPLVKCETIDLEVPAEAEIVLEGVVLPGERRPEGPFGEFPGYDAGGQFPRPVFEVRCITFRRDPVLTMANIGKPWDEDHVVHSITHSAVLLNDLRQAGIEVEAVYVPPPVLAVVVAVEPQYAGFVHTVAGAIWASKAGITRPFIFVVGPDVDVTNPEEVFWCLVTRMHPARDIHVQERAPNTPLMPYLLPEERRHGLGARVVFDATFPYEWPPEARPTVIDFDHAWPQEIREKVLSRWSEYGLD